MDELQALQAIPAELAQLQAHQEWCWYNPRLTRSIDALQDIPLSALEVADASARLQRFAPYIATCFPETGPAGGIIESDLCPVPDFFKTLGHLHQFEPTGQFWVKRDSHLPISGSIKARGGIYEVLKFAEQVALDAGLLVTEDNYAKLARPEFRQLFSQFQIAVGSTGNLGLSIGIMSAVLGFRTTVHMSADARAWKKAKLRSAGVTVVEYDQDYSVAVANGRAQAQQDPRCHFVDDEHSTDLFLGYAVAAERLARQFREQQIKVDRHHPLFVYLPCGVGGGPGGVAFGLKLMFGDDVHCFFAEPTHSPCMLLGMASQLHDRISVQDIGLDNHTAADGLAVGRPSGFVGPAMNRLLAGIYTVDDDTLYRHLALIAQVEHQQFEPSAMAGASGPIHLLKTPQQFAIRHGYSAEDMSQATHLMWATGGSMVPEAEMAAYIRQGQALL